MTERHPFLGKIVTGRIHSGSVAVGDRLKVLWKEGERCCCTRPLFVYLGLRSGSVAVGSCLKVLWKDGARGCAACCRLPALCSPAMHTQWAYSCHELCHTIADPPLLVPCHRGGGVYGLRWDLPNLLGCLLCCPPYLRSLLQAGRPWGSLPALGSARNCWAVYSFSVYVFNLCRRGGPGVQGHQADEAQRHRHRWGAGPMSSRHHAAVRGGGR